MVDIDSSLFGYFLSAGIVVKAVMILLVSASILSWTYIVQRGLFLANLRRKTAKFEELFSVGGDLTKFYLELGKKKEILIGLEAIFYSGFKEFLRLYKQTSVSAQEMAEGIRRAMRIAETRELDDMEKHLPFLAAVGSTSPYIGLFGTVWGIMHSFTALAHVEQATISMVAPGIAEALVATALGLFAAIPAVLAYNRYANEMNRLSARFSAFQDELTNILFRQMQQAGERHGHAMREAELQ